MDVLLKMFFEHVEVISMVKFRVSYRTSQVWILLHVHVPQHPLIPHITFSFRIDESVPRLSEINAFEAIELSS